MSTQTQTHTHRHIHLYVNVCAYIYLTWPLKLYFELECIILRDVYVFGHPIKINDRAKNIETPHKIMHSSFTPLQNTTSIITM